MQTTLLIQGSSRRLCNAPASIAKVSQRPLSLFGFISRLTKFVDLLFLPEADVLQYIGVTASGPTFPSMECFDENLETDKLLPRIMY